MNLFAQVVLCVILWHDEFEWLAMQNKTSVYENRASQRCIKVILIAVTLALAKQTTAGKQQPPYFIFEADS